MVSSEKRKNLPSSESRNESQANLPPQKSLIVKLPVKVPPSSIPAIKQLPLKIILHHIPKYDTNSTDFPEIELQSVEPNGLTIYLCWSGLVVTWMGPVTSFEMSYTIGQGVKEKFLCAVDEAKGLLGRLEKEQVEQWKGRVVRVLITEMQSGDGVVLKVWLPAELTRERNWELGSGRERPWIEKDFTKFESLESPGAEGIMEWLVGTIFKE